MSASVVFHVILRSLSVDPSEPRAAALSLSERPTGNGLRTGVTCTPSTATAATVIVVVSLTPSHRTVIVADPTRAALTAPDCDTTATRFGPVPLL
jgi:hypothetical protein